MFPYKKGRDIFDPPTLLERILSAPVKYLISLAYKISNILRSSHTSSAPPIRVVCISDTHTNLYDDIPSGDILIHAGDLTNNGTIRELQAQIDWIASLPHKHKIAIAGNHDTYLDSRSRDTLPKEDQTGELDWKGVRYLQHASTSLTFPSEHGTRKLHVYGAPQIPLCGGSKFAFQYPRGQDAWTGTIPTCTDILVTHTPPKYHRDLFLPSLGCEFLLREVWRVRPTLHVFGHVHWGAGRELVWWDDAQKAYESGSARKSNGLVRGVLDIGTWLLLGKVVLYGASGIIWNRIWGGEQKSTVLINAGLMAGNSGKLGNKVQVVDI